MRKLYFFVCFFLINVGLFAQYKIKKIDADIVIDGKLDEAAWANAATISNFYQYFPDDKAKATYDTEVKILYDSKNLYIAAKMYSKGSKYITPSFKRDFRAGGSDNITFCIDTFDDHTNGFLFGTNPYGVMREGLMFGGASDNSFLNIFWDNKWVAESSFDENAWYTELAIPFSTLRFKENSQKWNFKTYRFDSQSNETSSSIQTSQNQIIMNLGYTEAVEFEYPLGKNGANIAFIPYVSARNATDFESKNPREGTKFGIGADAKVAITSGLNLDLTVNPDFSNVAVDKQVVNLTRFDINLPEQRQFFLENADLFSGFGSVITNPFVPSTGTLVVGNQLFSPFFSRKIGISVDSVSGLSVQSRMNYGARLSGKIDDNWRIGILNTQTAKDEAKSIDAVNYSVFALQRKVFDRSNIAAIFVNNFNPGSAVDGKGNLFNRVGGLEYNLTSKNNEWQGKLFYHKSFENNTPANSYAHGGVINYSTKKFIFKWSHDYIGDGFVADAGFVPRKNFWHFSPTVGFNFFPKESIFNRYSFGLAYDQYNSNKIGLTDRKAGPFGLFVWQNTSKLLVSINQNYTYLFSDFDALRSNKKLPILTKGSSFTYYNMEANLVTDLRQKVSLVFNPLIGQYYDGNIKSVSGNLNMRFQPYGILTLNYSYNDIRLSKGQNKIFIVGPNLDLTLNKKLFWTSYVQYNSQFNNLNVNSRIQWRFAPVSDFFLVYTDNYNTEIWMPKSKGVFAKLNYWFSI
jgi:hypothetical protein